jgi:hypothetical protein
MPTEKDGILELTERIMLPGEKALEVITESFMFENHEVKNEGN